MASSLRLSPKHGVNPTLSVCFWCGEERGDIALLGRIGGRADLEAPKHAVVDFQPCDCCRRKMNMGFTLMEATECPNDAAPFPVQDGVYPTGRWCVIQPAAADRIFGEGTSSNRRAFLTRELYRRIVG